VLFHPEWHKGVIGIVASRCIEYYHRPTIILTQSNGKAAGSARSVRGFSIYNALCACEDLLEQFGGHDYAAGMTLPLENIKAFQERFEQVVKGSIPPELLIPTIEIDAAVQFDQLTANFYKTLCRMEPFGPGNMSPVFSASRVYMAEPPRLLKEKHVKLVLKQDGNQGMFECLGFNMPDLYPQLDSMSMRFDIAFSLDQNDFNGNQTLQLMLRDVKLHGAQ
jgi:single-stranded-DNA-specific exonuclease